MRDITEKKRCMLEHIKYEFVMLKETFNLWQKTPKDIIEHNAFLESSLIHLRCLIAFFECTAEKAKVDDIICSDYIEDFIPEPSNNITELHKYLAHLTTVRCRTEYVEWGLTNFQPTFNNIDMFKKTVDYNW